MKTSLREKSVNQKADKLTGVCGMPMKFKPAGFQYRRRCHRCQEHKLMAGGWTAPGGRGWICAECRKPGKPGA